MSRHERRRAARLAESRGGLSQEDVTRLLKDIAGTVAQSLPGNDVTVIVTTRGSDDVSVDFATTAEDRGRIGYVVRGLGEQLVRRAQELKH